MWTQYASQGFRTRAEARSCASATNVRTDPERPGLRWRAGRIRPAYRPDGTRYWIADHFHTRHQEPAYRGKLPAGW